MDISRGGFSSHFSMWLGLKYLFQCDFSNFLTYFSECKDDSDCGTNSKCFVNACSCVSGTVDDGENCVGT